MTLSLNDLTPSQRRLLAKLCGPGTPAEAIGCEVSELTDEEMMTCLSMAPLGLIEADDGWRGTHWLMLTGYAHRLLAEGLAE